MNKEEKISVYLNTIELVQSNKLDLFDTEAMVKGTQFYSKKLDIDYDSLPKYDSEIKVIDSDTLYAAKDLVDKGYNPCVLNMASFHTPGGGVLRGSSAQEENIFRRTNLFQSLYQFHKIGEEYGIPQRKERYPLDYRFGAIYTPNVTVFKESDDKDYALMDVPFKVSVISSAAVKNPTLEGDSLPNKVIEVTRNKIRQILDIALANGHDSIVLSAFGCGAYKNPPHEVAKIFKEVLSLEEYRQAFKVIEFAIINLQSTNDKHNPQGNFKPFYGLFNQR